MKQLAKSRAGTARRHDGEGTRHCHLVRQCRPFQSYPLEKVIGKRDLRGLTTLFLHGETQRFPLSLEF